MKTVLFFFLISFLSNEKVLRDEEEKPMCADKDLLVGYGVCENDKRDIIFFLPQTCNGSVYKLPDVLRDKPCNFVCDSGSYFNFHTGACESCPAGWTPIGRALEYSNWTEIPKEFISETDARGKAWEAAGYFITARDQPPMAVTSISVDVDILASNGTVTFSYEASPDSQLSAPLYFFIDGKIPESLDSSLYARVWKELTFPLKFGTHRLTWKYETSTFHNSSDEGPKIRSIVVTGTHYLNIQCVQCQPGEYSRNGTCSKCQRGTYTNKPGSVNCEPCSEKQTSFPGATSCHAKEPCTEHDYTYTLTDCKAENTTTRKRMFNWIEPIHCNPADEKSVKLPATFTEECAKCDPGTYRPRGEADCKPCEEGFFRSEKIEDDVDEGVEVYEEKPPDETGKESKDDEIDYAADEPEEGKEPVDKKGAHTSGIRASNRQARAKEGRGPKGGKGRVKRKRVVRNEDTDDDSKCFECGAGYHAAYTKYIKHVEKLLDVFSSTTCISDSGDENDCATYGWRAMEDYIDSGNYHSGPVQVVLTLDLNSTSTTTSYIEFEFTTHLLNGSKFKYFTTNGVSVVLDSSTNDLGLIKRHIELDQLDTNITWVFQKGWNMSKKQEARESDFVRIERIIIHGVEDANSGATECRKCPAGTHSPPKSRHCNYCGEGHYAPAGSYECLKCDNDSYTSRKGQGECSPCGSFTHASEDRKTCVFDECGFYYNETHEFDLSDLVEPEGMLGPLFSFDGNTRYFFNLCDKNSSKLLCSDYAGNSVDAYACQMQYTSRPISLGNKMSFNLYDDPESDQYGVTVTIYDGDMCRVQHAEADTAARTKAESQTQTEALTEAEKAQQRMRQLFANMNGDVSKRIATATAGKAQDRLSADAVSKLLGVAATPSNSLSSLSASALSFPLPLSAPSQEIPRSATLKLICLPGSGFGMPVLSTPAEFPACNFNFEWVTEYACKLCQYEDIVRAMSPCIHKQRNISYHYDKNARCSRGVPLPEDEVLKCKRIIRLGVIEALIGVGVILVIILTAVIIIITLCRKNKQLKYQALKNDSRQVLEQHTSLMDEDGDDAEKDPRPKKKRKKGKKGKSQFSQKTQSQNETNPSLFSVGEEQV